MGLMTGIGPYRLGQLIEGHHEHLSLPVRRHLRVLADLAETSAQPGDEAEAAARAGWLLVPSIDTDFGRLRPLEYLADRRLAAEGGQALLRSG